MNHLEFYIGKDALEQIKKCDDLYRKAWSLVELLFVDRTDKQGKPYLGHLHRVSAKMTTLDGKVAGLLHDVVEDIKTPDHPELDVTFDDLKDIGIPERILEVLRLVTKNPSDSLLTQEEKLFYYYQEIDHIIESGNRLAIELKTADMSDNYNPERLKGLSAEKRSWFERKYSEPYKKLVRAKERKITC